MRIESKIECAKTLHGANEKDGAGDEQNGEGDLASDERAVYATRAASEPGVAALATEATHGLEAAAQQVAKRRHGNDRRDEEPENKGGAKGLPAHGHSVGEATGERKPCDEGAESDDGDASA